MLIGDDRASIRFTSPYSFYLEEKAEESTKAVASIVSNTLVSVVSFSNSMRVDIVESRSIDENERTGSKSSSERGAHTRTIALMINLYSSRIHGSHSSTIHHRECFVREDQAAKRHTRRNVSSAN